MLYLIKPRELLDLKLYILSLCAFSAKVNQNFAHFIYLAFFILQYNVNCLYSLCPLKHLLLNFIVNTSEPLAYLCDLKMIFWF